MATIYESLRQQAKPYEAKIKSLLNSDLKTICKEEGLQVSGVKSTLQQRVLDRVNDAIDTGDSIRLHEILYRISRFGGRAHAQPHKPSQASASSQATPASHPNWGPSQPFPAPAGATTMTPHQQNRRPNEPQTVSNLQNMFIQSPFYNIEEAITKAMPLPAMPSGQNSVSATFRLESSQIGKLSSDASLRLMLYCYAEFEHAPRNVAFPNQIEVKINNETYKGNLRGIKKKPGTTKPADIHPFVKRGHGYANHVNMIYASTDRNYSFVVCLVKKASVEALTERVRKGHFITKQSVINDMVNKAKDPDIVATSSVMSLKCPLSATRMILPCRSTICNHNQCFDATSFLQLQEQAPQWSCPICNKTFSFESLAVDMFVQEIVQSAPKSTEQVRIEPDGSWKLETQSEDDFRVPSNSAKRKRSDLLDLDYPSPSTAIDFGSNGVHNLESVSTPQSYTRTPTFSSREVSASVSTTAHRSSMNKRPAEDVIDLTVSDDDDDDELPRRPPKRQSTGQYTLSSNITPTAPSLMPHSHTPQNLGNYPYQTVSPMQTYNPRPMPPQDYRPVSIPLPPKPPALTQNNQAFHNNYNHYWQ